MRSGKSVEGVGHRIYIGQEYDVDTGLSYLNARYYEGSRGQFISQDPIFVAMGDNYKIRQKVGISLEELLTDPQQLNSYAYGRNNPLRYSDPDGNLSFDALINNPIESIRNVIGWNVFSLAGNLFNKPFSASLLRHSASLEPNNLTIDSNNQKQYGNPIEKIMETSQYKSYIDKTIQRAQNGQMTNSGDFEFEGRSDLYYSLHGANIESQVTQQDGAWVVNSTVTDRYDFNPTNSQTYKGTVTRLPATQAYKDQGNGILSNYGVNIKISDKVKK